MVKSRKQLLGIEEPVVSNKSYFFMEGQVTTTVPLFVSKTTRNRMARLDLARARDDSVVKRPAEGAVMLNLCHRIF